MKKLLVLLLISTLALFVFAGCQSIVPSEGEGEGEVETVTVDITSKVTIDGWDYVAGGSQTVTVTFPAPVTGVVQMSLSDCTGDYSKAGTVGLFPNADKTVWTGNVEFDCISQSVDPCACDECPTCEEGDCCATTITIISGACDTDTCLVFPVIVDCEPPVADLCVDLDECTCGGYEITFSTLYSPVDCAEDVLVCEDDCSGVAGWSINIYDGYPYDECCLIECGEPVFTHTGTGCPVEVTTPCLDYCGSCDPCLTSGDMELYVIFSIWDKVGNETTEAALLTIDCDSDEFVDAEFTLPEGADCYDQLTLVECAPDCPECPPCVVNNVLD